LAGNVTVTASANAAGITVDTTAPTVTNASAAYTSGTNTLVLTGTNYDTLLGSGESATTDIKARLDWTKLSWDINSDDGTTTDVTFSVADISSVKVTDSTHLTVVLTSTKGAALDAARHYAGVGPDGVADALDISAGFAKDLAGNASTTDAVANAPLTVSTPVAGDAVIDLGSYGQLINPVQVDGGNYYYYWDRNADGLANAGDLASHDYLDGVFKYLNDATTLSTLTNSTEASRYVTLNGVKLALPTLGDAHTPAYSLSSANAAGTAVGTNPSATGTNATNNDYNDYLAIWDAYNGQTTAINLSGTPANWASSSYWTATPDGSDPTKHVSFELTTGSLSTTADDTVTRYVALQVMP
jgi:hypothetical protein